MGIENKVKKSWVIVIVGLIVIGGTFVTIQNSSNSKDTDPAASASASASASTLPDSKCSMVTANAHTPGKVTQPTAVLNPLPKKFIFDTNCGAIEVSLDSKAPITITSLTALIKGKYYDNSICHRLTTQGLFVLQCGDPTLTGSGNPTGWVGYKDENLPKEGADNYPAGTVAMANSGPGTNGSQIFFVYENTTLGPNYTIWGKITKGLDVVRYIAKQGAVTQDANGQYVYTGDGFSAQPVQINSAKVS
jgi:peptidyl-prolyl cis-trans isomerase B (cyclophilin B)